jgi:hypothetical protein
MPNESFIGRKTTEMSLLSTNHAIETIVPSVLALSNNPSTEGFYV